MKALLSALLILATTALNAQTACTPCDDCDILRGDANGDMQVNISDAIVIFQWLCCSGPPPCRLDAADANDDGQVNQSDGIYILNGYPLPEPWPNPGLDPTWDTIDPECSPGSQEWGYPIGWDHDLAFVPGQNDTIIAPCSSGSQWSYQQEFDAQSTLKARFWNIPTCSTPDKCNDAGFEFTLSYASTPDLGGEVWTESTSIELELYVEPEWDWSTVCDPIQIPGGWSCRGAEGDLVQMMVIIDSVLLVWKNSNADSVGLWVDDPLVEVPILEERVDDTLRSARSFIEIPSPITGGKPACIWDYLQEDQGGAVKVSLEPEDMPVELLGDCWRLREVKLFTRAIFSKSTVDFSDIEEMSINVSVVDLFIETGQ